MIRTALEFIKKELETYFIEREQDPANYAAGTVVDLRSLMNPDGTSNINPATHITLMLAGAEEERREGKRPYYQPTDDKQFYKLNPPIELDLCLLFAAHHATYETALRDLSNVAAFFQANPVFDQIKYPSLNASVIDPVAKPWQLIERLSFTLHNLGFEQMNNLWAMTGAKYLPSLVYKMKMLTVFETKSNEKVASVSEINFTEN
jgi:hypothetical protein